MSDPEYIEIDMILKSDQFRVGFCTDKGYYMFTANVRSTVSKYEKCATGDMWTVYTDPFNMVFFNNYESRIRLRKDGARELWSAIQEKGFTVSHG